MVCLFRELVIFVGLPERGESEYRQAIKKRSGVNESVKMSIMDKRNFYRSLGLCGMERKVLKELAVYSVPFYPDYNDMIGSVKNSNYVVRYLKYLYVFNKQNKTITLMLPIKALKRLLSLVKLVSCK